MDHHCGGPWLRVLNLAQATQSRDRVCKHNTAVLPSEPVGYPPLCGLTGTSTAARAALDRIEARGWRGLCWIVATYYFGNIMCVDNVVMQKRYCVCCFVVQTGRLQPKEKLTTYNCEVESRGSHVTSVHSCALQLMTKRLGVGGWPE